MKYKKTTITGIALTLALVLAMTVGFASNPGTGVPDEESTTSSAPAGFQYMVVGDPENDDFLRVRGNGFYYDMPAEGWNTYGPYILDSAYGTGSLIEIYTTNFCDSEVEDYQRVGYTKIRETEDLAVLAKTEVLEYSDGVVNTIRREVYVFGHRSQEGLNPGCMMELRWIEENLTGKTANEPEIMRAIARSFTITRTDPTGEELQFPIVEGSSDTGAVVRQHTDHKQDSSGPVGCPPEAIDKDFYQKYPEAGYQNFNHHESGHHSDSHH